MPYAEDDPVLIVRALGQHNSIAMGSDWPHAEGLAEPSYFRKLLDGLTEQQKDDIMFNTAYTLVNR